MRMPFWRSEEDKETVPGTVFQTNTADATLADLQAQFVRLLGHARPAIAAQAQPMLIANMGQDHHVASLTMRLGSCADTPANRDPSRPSFGTDGCGKASPDSQQ